MCPPCPLPALIPYLTCPESARPFTPTPATLVPKPLTTTDLFVTTSWTLPPPQPQPQPFIATAWTLPFSQSSSTATPFDCILLRE